MTPPATRTSAQVPRGAEAAPSAPGDAAKSRRPDSLIRAAVGSFGTNVLTAGLSLVQVLIVARVLGPSGRGQVAFLIAVATLTGQLASLGMQEANVNLAGAQPALRRSLATNSLIASLLLGTAGALVVAGLVHVFPAVGGHVPRPLLWITLATLPMFVAKWHLSFLLQADYHFAIYNLCWIAGPLTTVLINAAFAVLGILTVESAIITWLAGQAFGLLILGGGVLRYYGFGRPDRRLAQSCLSFGLKTHVGRFMSLGNARADQWFVGSMVGSHALGIYSVAVAWAETLFYVPGVVVLLQRPDLVRATPTQAAHRAAQIFRRAVVLSVVASVGLIVLAPFLCATMFGPKFAGSTDQLRVLALSGVGIAMVSLLSNAVIAQRRPLHASLGDGAALVVTLALDILLIPHLAGLGASIATALAYTVGGVVMATVFLRTLRGRPSDLVPRVTDVMWYVRKARAGLGLRPRRRGRGRSGAKEAPAGAVLWVGGAAAAVAAAAVVAGAHSVLVPVALVAVVAMGLALAARPDLGLVFGVFLLWSDTLVVAAKYHGVPTPIELIVPLLLVMTLLHGMLRGDRIIINRGFIWMLVLFAAEATATIAMAAPDQSVGVARVEKFVQEGLIMYLLVINTVRTPQALRRAAWAIIAAGAFLSAIAVIQTLTGKYDHPFFGFAQLDQAYFLGHDTNFREQGPLWDANYFAQVLLPVLALSVVFARRDPNRRLRPWASACAALTITAIAFTYSRGAALAIVVLVIALSLFRYLRARQLLAIGAAVVAVVLLVPGYQSRLSSISISGATAQSGSSAAADESTRGRATENLAALLVFEDHPALGVGPGGFPLHYQEYALKLGLDVHQQSKLAHQGEAAGEAPTRAAHDIVLGLAADIGIVGLLAFLGLIAATLLPLLRARRRWVDRRPDLEVLATGLLLATFVYLIAGLFLSLAFERYFWLLLALGGAASSMLLGDVPRVPALKTRGGPREPVEHQQTPAEPPLVEEARVI
jgi:O-antigen/teichoic acid export membrane protein/O-antigen ligase